MMNPPSGGGNQILVLSVDSLPSLAVSSGFTSGNSSMLPSNGISESSGNSSMLPSNGTSESSGNSSMLPSNGTSESSGDSSMLPLNDSNITTSSQCTLQCRNGFYCQVIAVGKLNVYRPRCDSFEEYSHSTAVATDVFIILSAIASLISGIISAIRRK